MISHAFPPLAGNTTLDAYNKPGGPVTVKILKASNLLNKDIVGRSDPYVIVKIGSVVQKTSIQWNTLNPNWNESFTFNAWAGEPITLSIMDSDYGRSEADFLGQASVQVIDVLGKAETTIPLTYQGKSAGTITIEVSGSIPSGPNNHSTSQATTIVINASQSGYTLPSSIKVKVLWGESMPNTDFQGKSDPYVSLKVREKEHRTNIKWNTDRPTFDEEFVLDAKPGETLFIKVLDSDYGRSADDVMGQANVSVSHLYNYAQSGRLYTVQLKPRGLLILQPSLPGSEPTPQPSYPSNIPAVNSLGLNSPFPAYSAPTYATNISSFAGTNVGAAIPTYTGTHSTISGLGSFPTPRISTFDSFPATSNTFQSSSIAGVPGALSTVPFTTSSFGQSTSGLSTFSTFGNNPTFATSGLTLPSNIGSPSPAFNSSDTITQMALGLPSGPNVVSAVKPTF